MAMAPALYAPPAGIPDGANDYGFDVQVVPDGTDDDLSGDLLASAAITPPPGPFDSNLAATMDEDTKRKLVKRLRHLLDTDKQARQDWEETAARGVEILGLKLESRAEPWEGACGVHSTVLIEAVVRFGAQTIVELFPVSGPVDVRQIGVVTPQGEASRRRVQEDLNMFLTRRMREYRSETERLLFHLPICGSAFRKVYFDKRRNRPVSLFIPATDVVIPVDPTHLDWCHRIFHIQSVNAMDLDRRMANGELLDVELPEPAVTPSIQNPLGDKVDKLMGYEPSSKADGDYQIIEAMIDMVPDDFGDAPDPEADPRTACPYLVTWDYDSDELLAVYRNWRPEEQGKNRRDHFILYTYLPGFGVYGLGLSHLIGGITEADQE
jgi:hypothetical protein